MNKELSNLKCQPCSGKTQKLNNDEILSNLNNPIFSISILGTILDFSNSFFIVLLATPFHIIEWIYFKTPFIQLL